MNYKISFQERAKLGMEMLSKQSPVTLEEARAQVKLLKDRSTSKLKQEQHEIINESEEDIKTGKIYSQTEVQEIIESWQ
ncbi:hypothetical protein AAGV33_10480 [Flavobacterium sp. FBOR7N2.3]|uniref:Uncharacterized protein n=1 Tax=Flavobacterium magnesitis TaxID=3138077 RepID=A0ABV4TLK2_9FLAO